MPRRFRLLTDEHFPNSVVALLRKEGREVERVIDVLGRETLDDRIFAYAAENGLVWVTSDERAQRHARRFTKEGRPFVGMLVWTQQNRHRMREDHPFASGIRHIQPE